MTIVKKGHQGASNRNQELQTSNAKEQPRNGDLDESDLSEMGCELAIVGDQTSNIPYELYDLSDLKGILSLETWNSCLTEGERFRLAAYLPDMDQETFDCTIKELLAGDNFFFGSPMEKVFHGFKGGLYSLQVAPIREGLQSLQKRRHYHSLRLYHESMLQKFADMRRAWNDCLPSSSSVEEKVTIWKRRKDQKPVLLVDLNAIPTDEETISKGDIKEEFHFMKKTKYMEEEGMKPDGVAIDLNSVTVNTNKPKGKGVLKMRPNAMNPTKDLRIQRLHNESQETSKWQPKGVLKIKPKFDPFGTQHRAMVGTHASRSSPPLTYLHQTISDENRTRSLDRQREEFANINIGSLNNYTLLSDTSHKAADLQEGIFPSKNPPKSRMESDEIAQISTLNMFPHHFDHLEQRYKDHVDGGLSTTPTSTILSGIEREIMFPITYRRKKSHTKLNDLESLKKPSIVLNKKDFNQRGKSKTLKIKVKGWSEQNSHYAPGFLSGLQHGSPST